MKEFIGNDNAFVTFENSVKFKQRKKWKEYQRTYLHTLNHTLKSIWHTCVALGIELYLLVPALLLFLLI